MTMVLVLLIGLVAGTLAGVIGFGGTTILLPILTLQFGPKAAVPIMAIASILGNFARVVAWWRIVSWRAVGAYSVAAIPAAWLGAKTMLTLNPVTLELGLGVFFLAMIPLRRWFAASGFRVSLPGLAGAGAVIGFLTGIVANTGPINTPFFLAHGLTKGAFIGTEATASLAMFLSKATAFHSFGALPVETIINGVIVGASLMVGTCVAKHFLHALSEDMFRGLMDALLLVAGIAMIVSAGLA
ncbi:MAG: sulfite exporter TauE/SafE family protein [Hyphomicrobiaceae bacterium]